MAQGQLKNKKTCHVKEQKSKRVSRGIRISSKNQIIQIQKKMEKKLSAKNIQNIELQMVRDFHVSCLSLDSCLSHLIVSLIYCISLSLVLEC